MPVSNANFFILPFRKGKQGGDQPVKTSPLDTKIGLLPLISENGARTIGAIANPNVYSVMPKLYTTRLIPHFAVNSSPGGVYSPAAYADMAVTQQQIMVMTLLRALDHKNGEAYFLRFGLDGGDCWPGCGDEIPTGWGNGESKSRYKCSISR